MIPRLEVSKSAFRRLPAVAGAWGILVGCLDTQLTNGKQQDFLYYLKVLEFRCLIARESAIKQCVRERWFGEGSYLVLYCL
jgi:hypothetical protein